MAGLNLTNQVVTGDAAFMQRAVCQLLIKQQGHYRIVLKANQADLHQTVQDWFEPFPPRDAFQLQSAQALDLTRGRIERRELWALPIYDAFLAWPGARLMLRLERTVIHKATGEVHRDVAYALSSLDLDSLNAHTLLTLWRHQHWYIENRVHYVADVTWVKMPAGCVRALVHVCCLPYLRSAQPISLRPACVRPIPLSGFSSVHPFMRMD